MEKLNDSELRLHVGFGYYLAAPVHRDIWLANRFRHGEVDAMRGMFEDYLRLTNGLPEDLMVSEPDPCRHLFSCMLPEEYGVGRDIFINTDVLRTQCEVSNLFNLGLIQKGMTVIEIGGGYGALAAALCRTGFVERFFIIDIPQIAALSSRWLSYLRDCGELQLDVNYGNLLSESSMHSNELQKGVFVLPAHTLGPTSYLPKASLLLNTNSFCEMASDRVLNYLDGRIQFDFLYSSNRDKQFMNQEIESLNTLLTSSFSYIFPTIADYSAISSPPKKFVFVCSNQFNGDSHLPIDLTLLHGVWDKETPALG